MSPGTTSPRFRQLRHRFNAALSAPSKLVQFPAAPTRHTLVGSRQHQHRLVDSRPHQQTCPTPRLTTIHRGLRCPGKRRKKAVGVGEKNKERSERLTCQVEVAHTVFVLAPRHCPRTHSSVTAAFVGKCRVCGKMSCLWESVVFVESAVFVEKCCVDTAKVARARERGMDGQEQDTEKRKQRDETKQRNRNGKESRGGTRKMEGQLRGEEATLEATLGCNLLGDLHLLLLLCREPDLVARQNVCEGEG
eukprot:3115753-Rhodomonas_salina.1